ncbi:hypothetical protein [Sphingobium sp.]|uniref:hypothetical protein n=1 Tax=Sphingobium sp. TaxID=1912891 RepID=UPI003B3ADEE6
MSDEPKSTRGFDISLLGQPLLLDIPHFGTGRIDAITTDFLSWFRAGERSSRWSSRDVFLRALLLERTALQDGPDTPLHDQVARIDHESLDAIDQLFMHRIAPHWRLDHGLSSESLEEQEADTTPVGNFLDHMRRYADGDINAMRALMAKGTGAFSHSRILDQINPVLKYLDGSDPVGKAIRLAQEQQKLLGGIDKLGLAARGESLSREVDRILHGMNGGLEEYKRTALPNVMRGSAEFTRAMDQAMGLSSALNHASVLEKTHASSLARGHADFSREIDRMLGIGIGDAVSNPSKLHRLSSVIGDTLAKHYDDLWADHNRFGSALYTAKAFGLGLGRAQLDVLSGAITGALPLDTLSATGILKKFFEPGFRSAAALGISGAAGQGLVSDVLRSYDKSAAIEAALFSAVVDSVHVIGDPGASAGEVGNALHIVIAAIESLRQYVRKEYEKAGLIATLALIASLVAIWISLNPDHSSEISMLKEVREANQQLGSIRNELRDDVTRTASSQIRYVHAATPLRTSPGREGLIIRRVYPDQWLRVLESKGDWAHVEVFDYQSDASIDGWMHRSHLRRLGR